MWWVGVNSRNKLDGMNAQQHSIIFVNRIETECWERAAKHSTKYWKHLILTMLHKMFYFIGAWPSKGIEDLW